MDISKYIKKTGIKERVFIDGKLKEIDEEIITSEDISKILDAENGKVHIFAVVYSIYNNERDIPGGFFSKAYNSKHLFSKNLKPAADEFYRIKEYLQNEHSFWRWEDKYIAPDAKRIKKMASSNIAKATFDINPGGHFKGLSVMFKEGWEAEKYGDKISLAINSVYLSIDDFEYSSRHKAICWTYECYLTEYVPIALD